MPAKLQKHNNNLLFNGYCLHHQPQLVVEQEYLDQNTDIYLCPCANFLFVPAPDKYVGIQKSK
jgi:hypothetical protein